MTNFFVLDGLLTREFDCSADALRHLVLPAIALATIPFAVIFRISRASVLDVLDEDYVRTAEAKGLANLQPLAQAFTQRDYAVLQVLILATATIYVLVNLLVDISYAIIDPRVRAR